jgi:tellurite resistance protein
MEARIEELRLEIEVVKLQNEIAKQALDTARCIAETEKLK